MPGSTKEHVIAFSRKLQATALTSSSLGGIRKEERASRFYRSLSKYKRGEGAQDEFVRVNWTLNQHFLSALQPLPNRASVTLSTDAASGTVPANLRAAHSCPADATRKAFGIENPNSSIVVLDFQVRDGVDRAFLGDDLSSDLCASI